VSALVLTDHLTKRYGPIVALDDCSLSVAPGEVFGLLGPNGAGKTTLVRLLLGFLRPTHGSATIDGLDCLRQSVEVRRRVSYLPGEPRLFPQLRGSELLDFFCRVRGGNNLAQARKLAERLDLDVSRRVSAMSTGMRHKLALSAVLAAETPLVILDEPTANLDPTVRAEVAELVREARQAGRTVLFSSHVLSEVEEVCDRVAILRAGRLVHEQPLEPLRRRQRIRATLAGPLPAVPEHLAHRLNLRQQGPGEVIMETEGDLATLLGWLATLPLRDMSIEPVGLKNVYEQFHGGRTAEARTP